jgi:predicted enzyme related to lactoylglutathione lyase
VARRTSPMLAVCGCALLVAAPAARAQDSTLRIQSISLVVPDYDAAKQWYAEKLGFTTQVDQRFGATERFVRVGPPGQKDFGLVLQLARRAPDPAEPAMPTDLTDRVGKAVNVVLWTRDAGAYADSLRRRGVTFTSALRRMPWGTQATFTDTYGNSFVIVGPATPGR